MIGAAATIGRSLRDERGSAGISTFFAVIIMIMLLGVGVGGMRTMTGQGDVTAASRAAARAAAIEHDYGAAAAAADLVATAEIDRADLACQSHTTSLDTPPGDFVPGGIVTVTVTCTVSFEGLYAPWSSGLKTLTGTSSEPIDCLRGGAPDVVTCGGF